MGRLHSGTPGRLRPGVHADTFVRHAYAPFVSYPTLHSNLAAAGGRLTTHACQESPACIERSHA